MSKLIPNVRKAEQLGVTTRTLYEWERKGILPPAVRVRGRRYHAEDSRPKFDEAKSLKSASGAAA